jgi:GNAT superfamily N-acetyltransferase
MATLQRETDTTATNEAVLRGLSDYNAASVGPRNSCPLAISLRDEAGTIVGGLIGELKWQWLHVDLLWIDDAHRGLGYGDRLMAMAEQEAREFGARGVYLSTMSLQAPDFYPRLGYRECGRMEDYPVVGQRVYHFAKRL